MTNYFDFYRTNARLKNINSVDVATRCLFKAFYARSEDKTVLAELFLTKSFNPIVKPSKLNSGSFPYQAMKHALSYAKFFLKRGKVDEFVSEEDKEAFLTFIETVKVAS